MNAEQIITMAAKGNEPAAAFCRAWYNHCRLMDDLYDKDCIVTDDRMTAMDMAWLMELGGNPFFIQHRAMLIGTMLVSINAWQDSNRYQGAARAVLAGMYHEVIYLTAFLVGGRSHLRHVTSECRDYKGLELKEDI